MHEITQATIISAQERITEYVHLTPVMTSRIMDRKSGASLFFKCENFQRMGAFKMRGATNAILSLNSGRKAKGVVTHSSGNFAQAVALAGRLTHVDSHIVMPENAPSVKKAAVEGYGGKIYI
ncbi:MAG: pyridoxal-phosphate dependent enzyme, partial [Bacteroidia bacterium]|nr:pyridoxal-phosphate dependent enzyme [Bacteroidia bacterium]